jgi:hypothetical protein
MDQLQAQGLAEYLMYRWNLDGWRFEWNESGREGWLGACSHRRKQIALSLPFALMYPEAYVRDTILHEIAHALAPSDAGHGPKWRAWAKTVGARPRAWAEKSVFVPFPGAREPDEPVPLICLPLDRKKDPLTHLWAQRGREGYMNWAGSI